MAPVRCGARQDLRLARFQLRYYARDPVLVACATVLSPWTDANSEPTNFARHLGSLSTELYRLFYSLKSVFVVCIYKRFTHGAPWGAPLSFHLFPPLHIDVYIYMYIYTSGEFYSFGIMRGRRNPAIRSSLLRLAYSSGEPRQTRISFSDMYVFVSPRFFRMLVQRKILFSFFSRTQSTLGFLPSLSLSRLVERAERGDS